MATDTREPSRSYPIPDPDNLVSEEFPRLAISFTMIGTDIAGLLTAVAGKAATSHTHSIANVTGLQAALDAKLDADSASFDLGDLNDVDTTGVATFQVLMKGVSGWQPGVVDAANISGLATQIAGASISASQITGVLDPARIPVLLSQTTVISAGGIANLTSGQQGNIVTGTHVTTTDGRRWVYSGTGSKTAEASYIELADVTPDWSVIANKPATFVGDWNTLVNKPSTFAPAAHTHPASAISDSTVTGRSIITAANAAAVRTAAEIDGRQTIWVPASAMIPRISSGSARAQIEIGPALINLSVLDFDPISAEAAHFIVRMPKSWNEGAIAFRAVWCHVATATNFGVVWFLSAVAISDDDTFALAAHGGAQGSTDTGGTGSDCYISPESAAITVAGSPQAEDLVHFHFYRDPGNVGDTLAIDARLVGITIYYTSDAARDD